MSMSGSLSLLLSVSVLLYFSNSSFEVSADEFIGDNGSLTGREGAEEGNRGRGITAFLRSRLNMYLTRAD